MPTRKTVTVLFSDLSGFTPLTEQLDPESLHEVMARYFRAMHASIDRHGGRVEKYIGDAIMAVFGVPQLHEDDAVRAARCALEMRDAVTELNAELESTWGVTLQVRYGLATGEVAFARVGSHPFFALGDPVNVAQRLESAAPPDEVLVGAQTARLLGGAARLEPLGPLTLKGKATPVAAWRLVAMLPAGEAERNAPSGRLVGRERELAALHAALEEAGSRRRCRMLSVVGAAGVGKSCLASSFVTDVATSATAVFGHCLSYGEGITFWPLAEIVEQLADGNDEAAIAAIVGDDDDGRWAAARVARAVGFAPGAAPLEEIQLALRRFLEAAARRRPLIVVIEDIHWAEPTLLDVLEHVAVHAEDAPLLLLGLARHEIPGRPPDSPAGDCLRVDPLSESESSELLERLDPGTALGAGERGRLLAVAEGNPFFLEQMVAMTQEAGPAATVPATIQAVLAARIDGLPQVERAIIDCAAVEGRQFHREVVAELLDPAYRAALDEGLVSLVRRDLISPARADLPGDEGYRFSHILVRDEVYALLPKARRAHLHERFAQWLAGRPVGERDFGEIIGFHFEQAHRWSTELQPVRGADHRRLARAGAHRLGAVGRTALGRGDLPAAVNLLERAIALLDDDEPALGWLLPELGATLTQAGRLPEADAVLAAAVERAAERGEPGPEAHALVCHLFVRMQVETGPAAEEVRRRFSDLFATFTADGDELGLDRLWRLRALVHWIEARCGDADAAWTIAARHAGAAGDEHGRADALSWLASSAFSGPAHALEGIARCEAIRESLGGNRRAEAFVLQPAAALWAMRGEFDTARALLARSNAMLAELGVAMHTAVPYHEAFVALLAGDAPDAEASLRAGYERLRAMGEKALHADTAAMLARAVYAQDRLDEAMELTREAEEEAAVDDLSPRIGWRTVRAGILARRGALGEAEGLSAEAVAMVEQTDWSTDHADALMARAEVLEACLDNSAAREAMLAALALHEAKGNVVAAERVRDRLARAQVGVRGSTQPGGGS